MDLFADLPDASRTIKDKPIPNASNGTNLKPRTNLASTVDSLFGDLPAAASCLQNKAEKRQIVEEETAVGVPKRIRSTDGCLFLQGFFAERQGERDEMQDALVIIDDFTSQVSNLDLSISRLSYYAVFDGHGGARASKFAAANLHRILADKFPKGDLKCIEKEIKKMFIEVYKKTDDEFLKQASKTKPSWKDGSTATTVLVVNDTVYIANLGDSKAILCRKNQDNKLVPITLTSDHNPTLYDERIRIQKAGGQVKDGRVLGQLEVSRSFGDGQYKAYGVSCIPDVKRCQLTENDKYLVIACDGVWKSVTNTDCVKLINTALESENISATELKTEREVRYDTACAKIAGEAVKRLSADNVSIIIVSIGKS